MSKRVLADYPHLEFRRCWKLNLRTAINLGKCSAYIQALGLLPIPPEAQDELRLVAFQRGAQATTAIEGNTLTDEELRQMLDGEELPKSRHYQAKEVKNALDVMNTIRKQVVDGGTLDLITPRMLCNWNKQVGQDLGPLYDGIPGRFRKDRRHIGSYLAPPHEEVVALIAEFCKWLRETFGFGQEPQAIEDAIQQAISAHVYFEWIHPFADGNGRTGRLLEFYILLRAGLPDITVHILANHYNGTRSEYTANFDQGRKKRDLSQFMDYAVQGLTDGLAAVLERVQVESCKIAWESYVHRVFSSYTDYNKRSVLRRRRSLALAMPIDGPFSLMELVRSSDDLMAAYMKHDKRMLKADAQVLLNLGLMKQADKSSKADKYYASIGLMLASHLPSRVRGS